MADVIFNEDAVYEGKKEALDITLQELQDIVNTIEEPEATSEDISESTSEPIHQNFEIAIPLFDGDVDEYEPMDKENEDENLVMFNALPCFTSKSRIPNFVH